MADADLRARLESHAKAFEGMMSLIPADYYYGKDNSDQWQRKKQTKEEKKAARKAKLNPENYKSALDVHKEKERKRKRELEGEGDDAGERSKDADNADNDSPKRQKLEQSKSNAAPKVPPKELTAEENEAIRQQKAEKRRQQRERKNQKRTQKRERQEAQKKAEKKQPSAVKTSAAKPKSASNKALDAGANSEADSDEAESDSDMDAADGEGSMLAESPVDDADEEEETLEPDTGFALEGFGVDTGSASEDESVSSDASSDPDTPTFDNSAQHSSSSSTSSIVPPSDVDTSGLPPKPSTSLAGSSTSAVPPPKPSKASAKSLQLLLPNVEEPGASKDLASSEGSKEARSKSEKVPKFTEGDSQKLKERLESRLAALRAARKADGPNGKPAKNRQDLIEARREKQERRKQHKKELRQKARQEQSAEAEAARLRGGSGSPMWSPNAILSPRDPLPSFSFGKVAFGDGQEMDVDSGATIDAKKKKGPQDVKTALEAAQKKQQRISGLDDEKRQNIQDKDRWLSAKKRVQGEKVRDNTSLLKKTLKRKEKGKAKSEKDWGDRIEGVAADKAAKQRKREENLTKRKEEKGSKKGGKKPAPKPKKRPGFEGSWKLGTQGGRK